jgi:glycosyltransferase involved in cell wall biosynthesis
LKYAKKNIVLDNSDIKEKKFVFVISSFNNAKYCEKNLNSILSQNYENFRVIYIDDASTDNTYSKVLQIAESFSDLSEIRILHNGKNLGSAYNVFKAVHSCNDDEIVCIVDGGDWLFDENVLQKLNNYYADPNVWLTYGQSINYPSCIRGDDSHIDSRVLMQGLIRRNSNMTWHMKTFYAGLFKKIRPEDFKYQGVFTRVGGDIAAMFAMIDLARNHTYYVDEVLYVYNTVNPVSIDRGSLDMKNKFIQYLRKLPVYEALKNHPAGYSL